MIRKPFLLVPVLLACLAMPLPVRAADPDSVVSGTATASIDKPADTMRLQVQIEIEGTSLKDALDKLKSRADDIKAGLIKIGATEQSFSAAGISASDGDSPTDRRAALEGAMRDRMNAGRGPAASAPAAHYTASCVIKANWALKVDSPQAMILAAAEIKSKIKASKLLEAPKSAAQSEADEEATMAAAADSGQSPNTPVYIFVATVTDAESAKAMADAFAKAKASAANLAKAAGAELGALKSIQGQMSSDPEESYAMQEYMGSQSYRQMMMQSRGYGGDAREAISAQPGKVSMQVVVQASFAIK
jgi:uncharacterized protein YggE